MKKGILAAIICFIVILTMLTSVVIAAATEPTSRMKEIIATAKAQQIIKQRQIEKLSRAMKIIEIPGKFNYYDKDDKAKAKAYSLREEIAKDEEILFALEYLCDAGVRISISTNEKIYINEEILEIPYNTSINDIRAYLGLPQKQ